MFMIYSPLYSHASYGSLCSLLVVQEEYCMHILMLIIKNVHIIYTYWLLLTYHLLYPSPSLPFSLLPPPSPLLSPPFNSGDNKYSDKLSQYVRITVPHTSDTLSLTFGSSLQVGPCTASWAIDDVALYTKF